MLTTQHHTVFHVTRDNFRTLKCIDYTTTNRSGFFKNLFFLSLEAEKGSQSEAKEGEMFGWLTSI